MARALTWLNRFLRVALPVWMALHARTSHGQAGAGHTFLNGQRYAPAAGDHIVSAGPVPQWNQSLTGSPSGPNGEPGSYRPFAVGLDSDFTLPMLSFTNRQTDKELLLILPEIIPPDMPAIVLGAQFRGSAIAGRTNTKDKFAYLGRFPPDFVGNTVTDVRMLQANQMLAGHLNPWAHGYMETLFSDVFTFPTFNQGSFQVRQAYVTFGNLAESPLYAFLGKKTVNFGDMGTLNPFSQAMPWHYFAPLTEGAGVGYAQDGLTASVTVLNGSRGIRVADSEERGHLNNFAANMRYEFDVARDVTCAVGAGYLHGTIYDGPVAEHINPAIFGPRNGAWDVNTRLQAGRWQAEAEFVQTERDWPLTNSLVTAWRAELACDLPAFRQPVRISGGWSEGLQGPPGTEFEFNRQLVVGLQYLPHPNVMLTCEYVRSLGFAPLINLTTVSERDAIQNSVVLGIMVAL